MTRIEKSKKQHQNTTNTEASQIDSQVNTVALNRIQQVQLHFPNQSYNYTPVIRSNKCSNNDPRRGFQPPKFNPPGFGRFPQNPPNTTPFNPQPFRPPLPTRPIPQNPPNIRFQPPTPQPPSRAFNPQPIQPPLPTRPVPQNPPSPIRKELPGFTPQTKYKFPSQVPPPSSIIPPKINPNIPPLPQPKYPTSSVIRTIQNYPHFDQETKSRLMQTVNQQSTQINQTPKPPQNLPPPVNMPKQSALNPLPPPKPKPQEGFTKPITAPDISIPNNVTDYVSHLHQEQNKFLNITNPNLLEKEILSSLPQIDSKLNQANKLAAQNLKPSALVNPPSYNLFLKHATAEQLGDQALLLHYYQKPESAVKVATKALQFNPQNPSAHTVMGNYYYEKGEFKKAQPHFAKTLVSSIIETKKDELIYALGFF